MLGALFGRGTVSGHASRAATAARKASRAAQQGSDLQRAEQQLREAQGALEELEAQVAAETRALQEADVAPSIASVAVAPRKGDLQIARFAFAWVPVAPG